MDAGTNGRVFHYHADASPFGGNITAPLTYTISTQASSSVSEGGGHVHASVGNYEVMSAISVDSAVSEIYGLPNDGEQVWETHVTSIVRGLNILDIVKIDELTCKYMVKHPYDEATYYPSVDFTACCFGNVEVNGIAVKPIVDAQQFSRSAADVAARGGCWLEDSVLIDRVCTQNAALCDNAPDWVNVRYGWVPNVAARQKKGHVVCSLVQGFTGLGTGMTAYGHVLEVANLGVLYFGELIVYQGSFGVTMLRAEISPTASATAPGRGGKGLGATVGVAVAHSNATGSP